MDLNYIISMNKYLFIFVILIFPAFILCQEKTAKSYSDNPTALKQYVVDETSTLSSSELSSLIKKLQDFDKQSSTQIVVYLINTLEGESLEDVSVRIAEKNKIGRKDKNNGVLLLVVKNDRKIRIEVGYGLEGTLTDATSSQIIRRDITPSFKNGNYYEGINKGVDAIISVTKGEYIADKKPNSGVNTCIGLPIFIVVIFVFIFFSIFISIIRRIFGFGRGMYSGNKRSGWSNWGGGGFFGGGGSSFGGGSGFSGFSGGGGSFGGGGASGSW